MIIAVDFDGTICEHKFPEIGEEKHLAIDTLKHLQDNRHKIIIWTCREEIYITHMLTWLSNRNFSPDAINRNIDKNLTYAKHKIYADIYIDDRNFNTIIDWNIIQEYFVNINIIDT